MTENHWRNDISDLRLRALSVSQPRPRACAFLSPRDAARSLSGIMRQVARMHGVETMQRACAMLARCDLTWRTAMGALPNVDASTRPAVRALAANALGLLSAAGAEGLRAALAFWAIETDPAEWQRVAA